MKEPDHFSNVERVKKVIFPDKQCELQNNSASKRDNNARKLAVGDNDANTVGKANFNTTSRTGIDTAIRNSESTAVKSKPHSSLKLARTPKGRSRFGEETNAVMKSIATSETRRKDVSNDIEFFDDEVLFTYMVKDGKGLHDIAPTNGSTRDISSKGTGKNVDSSSNNRIKSTYPNLYFNENGRHNLKASFHEGQDVLCTDSKLDDSSNRDCFMMENRAYELEDLDQRKHETKDNGISELRDELQNDEPSEIDNAFNSSISILNESKENGFQFSKLLEDDAVGEKVEDSFLGCLSDLDASDLMLSSATADTCSKRSDKNIEKITHVKDNSWLVLYFLFLPACDCGFLTHEVQRFAIIEKPYAKFIPPRNNTYIAEILPESQALFTLLLFRYDAFLLHQSYPFALLRFVRKQREKPPSLCVHIDLPDNKYGAKGIRFLRSHCSGFVKLIVGYWSVSKTTVFVRSH